MAKLEIDNYKAGVIVRAFTARLLAVGCDAEKIKAAWEETVSSFERRSDIQRTVERMAENSPEVHGVLGDYGDPVVPL